MSSPRLRFLAAVGSGALFVLALPKPDLYYLSWIAPVPLLIAISLEPLRWKAFGLGYASGVAFFGGTCYWIVSTMATYGGLSLPISVGLYALFVGVFALHSALFAVLLHLQLERFGTWGLLLAAPTWVSIELLQTYAVFGGFPWMLVGYGLVPYEGLLQMVSVTGIYGLSFLLIGVGSVLALGLRLRNPIPAAVASLIMAVAVLAPGPGEAVPEDPLSVRLVQTNIDIEQSWVAEERLRLMDQLQIISVDGAQNPDLLIWPETPAPFFLEEDADFRYRMGAIARTVDAHFLFGYIGLDGELPSNSAGVLSPSGQTVSRYDKIHLVPFGEYVPLGSLLFFAESLVRNVGDFVPGSEFTLTPLGNHRLASTICYEDVFPALIRQFTRRGAEVIVNITNDGWFGSTSAPYQHLRMSAVRAAENRRFILRAANTGITAIIDPYGRVIASTALGTRAVLDGMAGYRSDLTFYVRFGDVFAVLVTILAIVMTGLSLGGARRSGGPQEKRHE